MHRTLTRCGFATGALLALTTGVNAMTATAARTPSALTQACAAWPGNGSSEIQAAQACLGLIRAQTSSGLLWLVQAQSAEPRKTFNGKGIVTAVDPVGKLTINHEPIEGLMPAMEMMFSVRPPALAKGVRPGDEVEFSVEGKTFTIVGLKVRGHTQ
jgi:Cu/Ag efflux protein CusF